MEQVLHPDEVEERGAKARHNALVRAETARSDFQWVVSDPRGRRFVWGLLAKAGVFQSTMGQDPHHTSYLAGKREEGIDLLARFLTEQPQAYLLAQTEAKDHR